MQLRLRAFGLGASLLVALVSSTAACSTVLGLEDVTVVDDLGPDASQSHPDASNDARIESGLDATSDRAVDAPLDGKPETEASTGGGHDCDAGSSSDDAG